MAAQINAKEIDGRSSKRSTLRAVKPAAMFKSASSVPCACASVNMSRRISFPTSTYQPILKPCRISRPPPNDRKTRSDHQPKRRLRFELFMRARCSFRQKNRFVVAFASQTPKHILLEASIGIDRGLGRKDGVWTTHLMEPLCKRAAGGFIQRAIIRRISERKI